MIFLVLPFFDSRALCQTVIRRLLLMFLRSTGRCFFSSPIDGTNENVRTFFCASIDLTLFHPIRPCPCYLPVLSFTRLILARREELLIVIKDLTDWLSSRLVSMKNSTRMCLLMVVVKLMLSFSSAVVETRPLESFIIRVSFSFRNLITWQS